MQLKEGIITIHVRWESSIDMGSNPIREELSRLLRKSCEGHTYVVMCKLFPTCLEGGRVLVRIPVPASPVTKPVEG